MKLVDIANRKAPDNKRRVIRQKNKRRNKSDKNGSLDSGEDKYRSEILRNIKMY